jgi:hypothetical protein
LYGRVLNLNCVGIACKGDGCYFDRSTKAGFMHSNMRRGGGMIPNHITLSVEDPIDPTNDTARGSFNMKVVRQVCCERNFVRFRCAACPSYRPLCIHAFILCCPSQPGTLPKPTMPPG